MQNFFEWFKTKHINPDDPWLILGKGPSFSKRKEYDLSKYHTLSLNHVCREQAVFVAHAIDIEVIEDLGDGLRGQCQYLVMPWVPHVRRRRPHIIRKFGPAQLTLPDYCVR